eukprot:gene5768-7177_t
MKSSFILIATVLLAIATISAGFPCGPFACNHGEICHSINDICSCIPHYVCRDVELTAKIVRKWVDESRGGGVFTQYDVTVRNNLSRDVKQIYIGTDCSLRLRDSDLWNAQRVNGFLTLPAVQPSINSQSAFTFGFILKGDEPANLWITAVTFA